MFIDPLQHDGNDYDAQHAHEDADLNLVDGAHFAPHSRARHSSMAKLITVDLIM